MSIQDFVNSYVKECGHTKKEEVQEVKYHNGPHPRYNTNNAIGRFRKYLGLSTSEFSREFKNRGYGTLAQVQITLYEKDYKDNEVSRILNGHQRRHIRRFIKVAEGLAQYAESMGYKLTVAELVKDRYNISLDTIDS